VAWQEVPQTDSRSGEVHIADVLTQAGIVVEFQRSMIAPSERQAREEFYGRMVWVVDGARNDFDPINFSNMRERPNAEGFSRFRWRGRSTLFARWHRQKPVFMDFGPGHGFWRIARFDPRTREGLAILVNVDAFVEHLVGGTSDFSGGGGPAS
jgi:hypothetical protein